MNVIKERPNLFKFGKPVREAKNTTIPKKFLTTQCESGILEGKDKDELKDRVGQDRKRASTEKDDRRTKTDKKRKNRAGDSDNNGRSEESKKLHTRREKVQDKPTKRTYKEDGKTNSTED